MARPKKCRQIQFSTLIKCYKPQGIPLMKLKTINITHEEMEAIRLKTVEGLNQTECACCMEVSQSTFQRILCSAFRKVGQALVHGMAIRIEE